MSCLLCGGFVEQGTRGRPRKFCLACRPRKRPLTDGPSGKLVDCAQCGKHFRPRSSKAKYCSVNCKEDARRVPCSTCGKPMWFGSSLGAHPTCRACRRTRPGYRPRRMRERGFVYQWTCAGCGVECVRPAVKGQRPKWCDRCRTLAARNKVLQVPPAIRLGIYERDRWVCWICEEPVDRSLIGTRDVWRPSLDHVIPRSHGGNNNPSNLRLAHFWCNSVRGDERYHTAEEFHAAV